MKQLMVFNIDNCQEDYSVIMEYISLIQESKIEEATLLFSEKLKGKLFRTEIRYDKIVPRYLECPRGESVTTSQEMELRTEQQIWQNYYKLLMSSKEIDSVFIDRISDLYYQSTSNHIYKASVPESLSAYFSTQKTTRSKLQAAITSNEVYFHIRIRVNVDTIYNLQYLSLFLKKFNSLVTNQKISVLLLNNSMSLDFFPFVDPDNTNAISLVNETHKFFSRYLRLLAKNNIGIIYAPYYEKTSNDKIYEPKILPMNFKDSASGDRFFPLMEIGEKEYRKLFEEKNENNKTGGVDLSAYIKLENLFDNNIDAPSKYSLFQTHSRRFFNADAKNPNEAMIAYIAETSWKRLQNNWKNQNEEFDFELFYPAMKIILKRFTSEKNTWLTFAIFSYMFNGTGIQSNDNRVLAMTIDSVYHTSRELANGIQQIIQNAIQHSEMKSCVFTFFLDDSNKLRLFVVDLNTKSSITSNFKTCLTNEIKACHEFQYANVSEDKIDYSSLVDKHLDLANRKDISLRHFFNVFTQGDKTSQKAKKSVYESWKDFRQSDSTAHIGLLLFYQALQQCNADLELQSSISYRLSYNDKFTDLAEFRNEPEYIRINKSVTTERIVPGTHYLITVPTDCVSIINPIGEASISNINSFVEDYATFAKFVDCIPECLCDERRFENILTIVRKYSVVLPDNKFKAQLIWTKFWIENFLNINENESKDKIYYFNTSKTLNEYFLDKDNVEIFLKGLFAALANKFFKNKIISFALTNLDSVFLESLKTLCISFANRGFYKNIQLYFIDKSFEKHIHLLGNSFYEALINSVKLSIEYGSAIFHNTDISNAKHIGQFVSTESFTQPISVIPFDVIVPDNNNLNKTIFDAKMLSTVERRLDGPVCHGYKLDDTHMRLGNKVHIQSFYEMSFLFYRTTISNRIAFKILRSYSKDILNQIKINHVSIKPILYYSYASYSKAILTSLVEITRCYLEQNVRKYLDYETENLKTAIQKIKDQVAFASYQHNLQKTRNDDSVQLYFGIPKNYEGAETVNIDGKGGQYLNLKKNVNVILVVPISSTLTTFDKMLSKLKERTIFNDQKKESLILANSYTAFWVSDENDIKNRETDTKIFPSKIEENYWEYALKKQQIIYVRKDVLNELSKRPEVYYFMRAKAVWNNPLFCSLCFPDENQLLREIPLVETDLTSTVPSQQIREETVEETRQEKKIKHSRDVIFHLGEVRKKGENKVNGNNYKIELLRDCVYYGHIKRSKNHHQYYISTQDYFYKNEVQEEVRNWLIGLRKKHQEFDEPKLQIIFSPEHNTNVGFAQYVNTYYFGGSAEIISINEDKVFRSNFVCEHNVLRKAIECLHIQKDIFSKSQPVEFYFVDDSINTGATIHKANSLLRSLLPKDYIMSYPSFLFKKCFILIDRLSESSKHPYTMSGDSSDFHSFVHIDISNMRLQGDSCVGCKLQSEAKKLFKKSASRTAASYWANKYNRLQPIEYDNLDEMHLRKQQIHAYERLALSHIAQNYIFDHGISTRKRGEYYDAILTLFEIIFECSEFDKKIKKKQIDNNFYFGDILWDLVSNFNFNDIHNSNSSQVGVAEILLKLLSRPFFSFDYSFRIQIHSFLIILAECYLRCYSDDSSIIEIDMNVKTNKWNTNVQILYDMIPDTDNYKGFLLKNNRIERTVEIAKSFLQHHNNKPRALLSFMSSIVFESLADIKSTYLLRKKVILRTNNFVKNVINLGITNTPCSEKDSFENNFLNCKHLLDSARCENCRVDKCFWICYFANIQRIVDCSSDEVRATWLEYLMLFGNELNPSVGILENFNAIKNKNNFGVQKFISSNEMSVASVEMFLSTSSLKFDAIEKSIDNTSDSQHFLKNYTLSQRWLNQTPCFDDKVKIWHEFLPHSEKQATLNNKVPEIDKRYESFLDNLLNYICSINNIEDKNIFHVALLSISKSDEDIAIENIQLIKDFFGTNSNSDFDIKEARYIVKDRVVLAWKKQNLHNDSVLGDLTENGYHIVFSSTELNAENYRKEQQEIEYDAEHHICKNHRKPYIVFLFDNPNKSMLNNELGRKLVPLSRVFLYISMNVEDPIVRQKMPWIVLRDILAYRNRILRFLSEDFNGDIMGNHAKTTKEETIITHERSSSHASTTDERGVLRVFGIGDVSSLHKLRYPISMETKKLAKSDENDYNYNDSYRRAELWILLQNYVNGQIARLFSRNFGQDNELIEKEGIPELYVSVDNEQKGDEFKKCLRTFADFDIENDNRFLLLKEIANINFQINDSDKFLTNNRLRYYNAEYMKCIFLDIIFSSIKYATTEDTLLSRVDMLMHYKNMTHKRSSSVTSHILFFRDGDFLVILNNVNPSHIDEEKIKKINEEIFRRTHDTLDYGDGHMSLFTIRRFVIGINDSKNDTDFKYLTKKEVLKKYEHTDLINQLLHILEEYDFWFETRLPVFDKEENSCEQ